jgi:hypothetical protein
LLAVVGNGPYSTPEIERFVGVTDIIEIADDPSAAAVLTAGRGTERRLTRSALVKSARRLARTVAGPDSETPEVGDPDVTPLGQPSRLDGQRTGEASETVTRRPEEQISDRPLSLQDQP